MIGGIVTEVKVLADRVYIDCEENNSTSKCAIYVERDENSKQVKPADIVWWQGGRAYWTPYDKSRIEVVLKRIGYSGVKRPVAHS